MPNRRRGRVGTGLELRALAEAAGNAPEILATLLATIRLRLKQHETTLAAWREPDGELVPTEPSPFRRRLIRAGLEAVVAELRALCEGVRLT